MDPDILSVSGRTVVITGASRGLGAGLAQYFSCQGMKLGLCARHEPILEMPDGLEVVTASVDVTDFDAVHSFAAQVVEKLGPIDLWINNAGVLGPIGPLRDLNPKDIASNLNTNLLGVFNGSQAFILHRREVGGGGVLLNISSGAAHHCYAGWSAYSAAKAGVERLTETIQLEEAGSGLHAYAVSPGIVDTDMQALIRTSTAEQFPEVERFRQLHKEGKLRQPEHVARYLLHLAFDPNEKPNEVSLRVSD